MARFFLDFEPFSGGRGRSRGAAGETSRTAPESGLCGAGRRGGRQATPARRRRAPGRLGRPRTEPSVSRGQERSASAACSARTVSRGSERSALTPSMRRVRRSIAPEWLAGCNGWLHALRAARRLDRRVVGIAGWPRCDVLQAPLWLSGDRCGSVDSIALAAALLSK